MKTYHLLTFITLLTSSCLMGGDIHYTDQAPTPERSRQHPLICWTETRETPLKIHYLQIDLQSKNYQLAVITSRDIDGDGPAEGSLEKPEILLRRHNALIAVNANAFQNPSEAKDHHWFENKAVDICGSVVSDSTTVSPPETSRATFWIDQKGLPHIGTAESASHQVLAVAGWNHRNPKTQGQLLRDGEIVIQDGGSRHPRTAIGFDSSKRWLTLAVVDGRRKNASIGVTLYELAQIMQQRGCSHALNFDGGGSSIMIANEGPTTNIINRPSGSKSRPVPVMIGVKKAIPSETTALENGLLGWWPLHETSGTIAHDLGSNKQHGQLTRELAFKPSKNTSHPSLTFDGVGDGISLPKISVQNQLTVSAWAQISGALDSGHVVSQHPAWFLSGHRGKEMRFAVDTGKKTVSVPFAKPDTLSSGWHHYVGVYNGHSVSTYLDGILVNQDTLQGNLRQEGEMRIGRYWADNSPQRYFWKGGIRDVRIYNRALSNHEIATLFKQGEAKTPSKTSPEK
ncbi:phosphodiester glycosidase family protein [Verrucomicrobiaceae bacterium N1E253]|uniref:Phosphodiester glycosidase family protein n=1 Tax=Oceaniferula marina TaxID=2748318 RepID=A0A851GNG4_9BACT|nr:phosphodiester glycosidase family protein [Oceaniferula marina]NWK55674.1 phosphodiester glycosidase family protein [Oceaniferula marina]